MRFATQKKRSAWLRLASIVAVAISAHAQVPAAGPNVNVQQLSFAHQTGAIVPLPQTLQVTTDPDRAFTATATTTTPAGGANWLTVNGASSASGTSSPAGSYLTVGVVPGSLPAGTYTGNIRIQHTGVATVKDIPVTLKVSAAPQVALTVPVVSIQGQTGTQVSLLVPVSSTGTAVPYSATLSQYQGAAGWLSVTPAGTTGAAGAAPTPSTVTASLTGVPAGTHYAVITYRSTGTDPGDVTLPVILNVTQATAVAANPAQLNFAFQASNLGATTNNKIINVTSSPSTTLGYTATIAGDPRISIAKTSTGPGTATVTGTTPENLYVIVNPVGIPAGTVAEATVTITTTNNTVTVPVRVTVTNAPLMAPSAESVNFNYSLGGSIPPAQAISLTSTTGQLAFTVAEAEVTGGDWLTVTNNAASTPANISLSVNQTRLQQLAAGTYTANVTITSAGAGNTPLTIPVTLTVSGTAGLLNVSTAAANNTLTFNADLNGTVPGRQTVSVSSTDNTNQAFTISVDPASASWVLLETRSGQTGTAGTFFTVGVSPSGVPGAGKHEADIIVTPAASPGTTPVPQKVHVVFNVNATTTVTANPARVEVTQAGTSGQAPAPVNVQLTSAVTGITFNASTQPSVSWLTVEPQSGTLNPNATVRLTFNTTGLAAGRHETVLRISPTGATEVSIPVTLTISNAQLNVSQATFNVNHIQGTPAPANLTVGLTSSNTPINFTAAATSTGNWLSVTPTTGVTGATGAPATNLTLAINPTGLAAGTHTGTVTITSPDASNSPRTVTVTLVVSAQASPVIASLENAARNEQTLIAPGLFLAVKGTNLGPATPVNGTVANGAFGTTVGETRVLFDGIAAPITYASATQVNVVAPFSLFGRTTTRVQVEFRGVRSEAIEFRVVDTAPGLFTQNATGRGLGAILNQNLTVNTAANPARRGEVIVLYATGEGRLRPSPVEGSITTGTVDTLPRPVAPVTVTINGQEVAPADILYAGSAPGIVAGVMQINVRLSPTLNITGPAEVPVGISVGGVASQSGVTVAVIP